MSKKEAIAFIDSIIASCGEALDGTWDKSDDGFEDIKIAAERLKEYLEGTKND